MCNDFHKFLATKYNNFPIKIVWYFLLCFEYYFDDNIYTLQKITSSWALWLCGSGKKGYKYAIVGGHEWNKVVHG